MNERANVIHKDHTTARVAPSAQPERERFGPVFETRNNMRVIAEPDPRGGPPRGSVDLCSLVYTDATDWERGTRVQDVITTVKAAVDAATSILAQVIGEAVGEEGKRTDKQFARAAAQTADLEKTIADANARSAQFEIEVAGLRAENVELRRALQSLSSAQARAATRAHKPPAKSAAAKLRPKANGVKSPDGATLPDFVTK
jgi:hypothetical protein